jgi:hypothetical protein
MRSPLRVAVYTFLACVVIGAIVAIVVLSANGNLHDNSFDRGREFGRGLGPIAIVAAVVAYFIQRKRLS